MPLYCHYSPTEFCPSKSPRNMDVTNPQKIKKMPVYNPISFVGLAVDTYVFYGPSWP